MPTALLSSLTDYAETLQQNTFASLALLVITIAVFLGPALAAGLLPAAQKPRDKLRKTHRQLGLPPQLSYLRDQVSPTHGSWPNQPPRVRSLFVYPVKSCKGIEVASSRVLPSGLEYDRMYTLAELRPPPALSADQQPAAPAWKFVTQRQLPLMANVSTEIWIPVQCDASEEPGRLRDAFLMLRFPWKDDGIRGLVQFATAKLRHGMHGVPEKQILLPISFPSPKEIEVRGYSYAQVRIWDEVSLALNMEKELPAELAKYLGSKYSMGLFRMDPDRRREVFDCAPRKEDIGFQPVIDFQDGYPVHMLNLSSMQALDSKVQKDATMRHLDARRFRSNIIISGADEYEEDAWKTLHIENKTSSQGCHFDVSCRTIRCKLPNVDPDTGIRHQVEPDRALRKFRNVDESAPKSGCMGVQLCPVFPGVGATGDRLSYIEVGMPIDFSWRA